MPKTAALLILVFTPAFAQEPERALESAGTRAEPTPHERLAGALLRYRARKDLVLHARVEHKKPEVEVAAPGGANGAIRVVIHNVNGQVSKEPFEGKVEAWRDAEGTAVIVTERELPGFGLYITADRTIRRVTTEEREPGTDQLRTELLSLMESDRFGKHITAAKLEHRLDEASGEDVWTGEIDKNIVRPVRATGLDPRIAQALGSVQPRVIRARIELRVSKDSHIRSAQVTIVRNDPAREMARGAMVGGRFIVRGLPGAPGGPGQPGQPGGKGRAIPADEVKDEDKHDIEGISSTYTLNFGSKEPSERAKAFKRQVRGMLAR